MGVAVAVGVGEGVGVGVGLGPAAQYLPPVFKPAPPPIAPPQTIIFISLSVHTAVGPARRAGALVMLVAVQLSVLGLYLPPVFNKLPLMPPQTIISLPVQTAV